MTIPAVVVTTVASRIPWKDVIAAAPEIWKSAKELFAFSTRKAGEARVDAAADARVQLEELAARLQQTEQVQANQAEVLTALAAQMQAITNQVQAEQAHAIRLGWLAMASCAFSMLSIALLVAG